MPHREKRQQIPRKAEPVEGGYRVRVEETNSLTREDRGTTSHFREVFVPASEMGPDKTPEERQEAIERWLDHDPLEGVRDRPLTREQRGIDPRGRVIEQ